MDNPNGEKALERIISDILGGTQRFPSVQVGRAVPAAAEGFAAVPAMLHGASASGVWVRALGVAHFHLGHGTVSASMQQMQILAMLLPPGRPAGARPAAQRRPALCAPPHSC